MTTARARAAFVELRAALDELRLSVPATSVLASPTAQDIVARHLDAAERVLELFELPRDGDPALEVVRDS